MSGQTPVDSASPVNALLTRLEMRNPLMHELLMASALPRAFDRSVLAAILDRTPDDAEFEAAFERLRTYPLVEVRVNGQLALHDVIRVELLDRWAEPDCVGDRNRHLERLRAYYQAAYEDACRDADALAEVGRVIRDASLDRYAFCRERVEDHLVRPAIEAVNTALTIGPARGLEQFTEIFQTQEELRRFGVCELLLRAYADAEPSSGESDRHSHHAWATYYAARLAGQRGDWQTAQRLVEDLPIATLDDHKIVIWLKGLLAHALVRQSRFTEALKALDDVIAEHERYHADDWNSSVPWDSKASIHEQLWDIPERIDALREATRLANDAGNKAMALSLRLRVAKSLHAMGDRSAATCEFMSALRTARVDLTNDTSANRAVAECGLELLGDSRRVLATFATLYREASQGLWPGGELDVLLAEATRLCDGGDVQAAAHCYEQAQKLASEHAPDRLLDVATDWAAYADKFGQPLHGAELNLAVLEDPIAGADLWTRVRCLTHASMMFLAGADYTRALDCIRQARPLWEGMGHRRAVALSTGIEAEILRRSGQREQARALIESVEIEPAGAYEGDVLDHRSHIRFDHSDYAAAGADGVAAGSIADQTGMRVDAVQRWLFAAECYVAARRYDEAVHASCEANRIATQVRDFATWTPTPEMQLADDHAARALAILRRGHGPMPARLAAAREHLETAMDLDPSNSWFAVEHALINVLDDRRDVALQELTASAGSTDHEAVRAAIASLAANLSAEA